MSGSVCEEGRCPGVGVRREGVWSGCAVWVSVCVRERCVQNGSEGECTPFSSQKLEFLQSGGSASSSLAYLTDLTRLFGSNDVTNDQIFDWIEVCGPHSHPQSLVARSSRIVHYVNPV